jgi:hypothetical protein
MNPSLQGCLFFILNIFCCCKIFMHFLWSGLEKPSTHLSRVSPWMALRTPAMLTGQFNWRHLHENKRKTLLLNKKNMLTLFIWHWPCSQISHVSVSGMSPFYVKAPTIREKMSLRLIPILLKKRSSLPSLGRNLQEVGFFFQEPSLL